jgi:hypothetical protein
MAHGIVLEGLHSNITSVRRMEFQEGAFTQINQTEDHHQTNKVDAK